jgi:hypothetical protein
MKKKRETLPSLPGIGDFREKKEKGTYNCFLKKKGTYNWRSTPIRESKPGV